MGRSVEWNAGDSLTITRLKERYVIWQKQRGGRATYEEFAIELSRITGGTPIAKNTVSQYINGKNGRLTISSDKLSQFAKVLGCRLEYLLGEDDMPTEDDIPIGRSEKIKLHLKLLEMLGYELRSRLFLHTWSYKNPDGTWQDGLRDHWKEIKPTLTKNALTLPINYEHTKTFADWDGKTPIPMDYTLGIPVRRTILGSTTDDYSVHNPRCGIAGQIYYSLEYEVFRDGIRVAWLTMEELEKEFSKFDRYADLTFDIAFEEHRTPAPLAGRESENDSIHDFSN